MYHNICLIRPTSSLQFVRLSQKVLQAEPNPDYSREVKYPTVQQKNSQCQRFLSRKIQIDATLLAKTYLSENGVSGSYTYVGKYLYCVYLTPSTYCSLWLREQLSSYERVRSYVTISRS